MNTGYSNNNTYNFTDNSYLPGTIYYRLKMTSTDGQASYSNILLFRQTGSSQHQSFTMYPSVIHDNATVNITSDKSDQASLLVFDLSGHMVYQKKMPLQQGNNNIAVSGFSSLHAGTYVATVKTANTSFNQRIIIQ